jgi:hypothetical protein
MIPGCGVIGYRPSVTISRVRGSQLGSVLRLYSLDRIDHRLVQLLFGVCKNPKNDPLDRPVDRLQLVDAVKKRIFGLVKKLVVLLIPFCFDRGGMFVGSDDPATAGQ